MTKKKYSLNPVERLMALVLLPPEGNLVTMKVVRELRSNIEFSEQELEDWSLDFKDSGSFGWDKTKPLDTMMKEIEIGPTMLSVLKDRVKQLDNDDKITEAMLGVIEKLKL